jgi:hypothetical protein
MGKSTARNELSMIPNKEISLKSSKFLSFQLVGGAGTRDFT